MDEINKIDRIKQLNVVRKIFKAQEKELYDWNEPEKYQEKRKQRKKIEKEIFNLIENYDRRDSKEVSGNTKQNGVHKRTRSGIRKTTQKHSD